MRILYFADLSSKHPLNREEDIIKALKSLGHIVLSIDENDFDMEHLIKEANRGDLFLFHHGGVSTIDSLNFQLSTIRLENILKNLICKKAFWFFEKVIGMGEMMMEKIIPLVDYGFLNDDTWIRRHKYTNIFPIHLAFGETLPTAGKYRKEYNHDIVFMGSVYMSRRPFMESMKEEFGDRFKIFKNKFGQDFLDMCKSAKIIVSPKSPMDNFYWSDRVYRTLIASGFLIHPKLEGIKEEFGNVLETYASWDELVDKIKYWLSPNKQKERNKISQKGKDFVSKFSYTHRLSEILKIME